MIYIAYLLIAAVVVFLSIKASEYVDLIDKKTSLSGAFIGGVLLSAVTSLPELFTSISATVLLDTPGLCIGNILGSDIFNLTILCVFILVAYKSFLQVKVAKSHIYVNIAVMAIYTVMVLNMTHILDFDILSVNITSIIIIALYFLGVKNMASENGTETAAEDECDSDLTVKQIVVRFVFVSIGIVASSIVITYVTDIIADRLNLGTGLAGALFLGIATSLPEMASTISLFKMRNYNIAIGNIVGSNLFNFIILGVADILYIGNGVYDYSDPKTVNLLICGAISTVLLLILMKFRNKLTQAVCAAGVIISYVLSLAI